MIRITIKTINKHGPLQFPYKTDVLYEKDHKVTHFQSFERVQQFLKKHDDRQLYEWERDFVPDTIEDRTKNYAPVEPPVEDL